MTSKAKMELITPTSEVNEVREWRIYAFLLSALAIAAVVKSLSL